MTVLGQVGLSPRVRVESSSGEPLQLGALVALEARTALSVPAQCELGFSRPADSDRLPSLVGTEIRVRVDGRPGALFSGEITAVRVRMAADGEVRLTVRAYDRLERLRRSWPMRAHVDTDAAGLAEALAGPLGLTVRAHRDLPARAFILQSGQSDLDLLVAEAARAAVYLRLVDDELELFDLLGDGTPARALRVGAEVHELTWEENREGAFSSVQNDAWSVDDAEVRTAIAFSELESGASFTLGGRTSDDEAATLALAEAVNDRGRARALRFHAVLEGDPTWLPGATARIDGAAGLSSQTTFVVTAVRHRIEAELGFVTELDSGPPHLTLPPAEPRATLAEVIAVDDPEARARVRVRLTALGGVETPWMPVCLPAAGPDRGLLALPDLDDRVLVLAPAGDYGQAIVLGGLFGPHPRPDLGTGGGRVGRFLLGAAGGLRVELDVAEGRLRVADGRGTELTMSAEQTRLSSAQDLIVEAPGRNLRLRADRIDLERA